MITRFVFSLTHEFAAKVEKTIEELKSQSERKVTFLMCDDFYELIFYLQIFRLIIHALSSMI